MAEDLERNRTLGNKLHQVYNLKALAKVAAFRGNYGEAEELIAEAMELTTDNGFNPELPGIHYMRANVAISQNQLELAEREIQNLELLTTGHPPLERSGTVSPGRSSPPER